MIVVRRHVNMRGVERTWKNWFRARRARVITVQCPMPMFDYYTIVSLYELTVACFNGGAFGFDPAKCSTQL